MRGYPFDKNGVVFALLFIIYHSGGAAQDRMHSSRHFFAGKRAKQKETGKRPSLKENFGKII